MAIKLSLVLPKANGNYIPVIIGSCFYPDRHLQLPGLWNIVVVCISSYSTLLQLPPNLNSALADSD